MALDTYEKGDTIDIPVTFLDPSNQKEIAAGVSDATVQIFKGNTPILTPTAMVRVGTTGSRYTYSYTISPTALSGVYAVYVQGTVLGDLQTATMRFSVTDRLTNLQDATDSIKLDIQSNKVDIDSQLSDIQTDIGDPSADGTSLHQELKDVKDDLGNPLATGQDITQKLDDLRTVLGLGTPVGSVAVDGLVLDDNGNPAGGVRVVAVDTSTGNASDTAITDATAGTYVINLNPGDYILQFIQAETILKQTLQLNVPTLITSLTAPTVTLATKRVVTDVVQDPEDNVVVVAEGGGKLIGFCVGEVHHFGEIERIYFEGDRHGEAWDLYTSPDWRGKGVAADMIGLMEREFVAKGCTNVVLNGVDIENAGARRLYEKIGYKPWCYRYFKKIKND